jgi:hypothetical protein
MMFLRANVKGTKELMEKFPQLGDEVKQIRMAAINTTIKGLRLDAGRLIRSTIAVSKVSTSNKTPKQVIESRIKLAFAKDDTDFGRLVIKESQIPIRWFNPKQIPKTQKGKKRTSGKTKRKRSTLKMLFSKDFVKTAKKIGYKAVKNPKQFNPFAKRKKKTVKGTTAKIMKGGSRVFYPRGFGPNVKKLGYTIWERTGKSRYPLISPYGVSVADIVRRVGGERQLNRQASVRLKKAVERRIKRIKYIKPRKGRSKK